MGTLPLVGACVVVVVVVVGTAGDEPPPPPHPVSEAVPKSAANANPVRAEQDAFTDILLCKTRASQKEREQTRWYARPVLCTFPETAALPVGRDDRPKNP